MPASASSRGALDPPPSAVSLLRILKLYQSVNNVIKIYTTLFILLVSFFTHVREISLS